MICLQPPSAGAGQLESLLRATPARKPLDRLQTVLMAHRGRPRQEIATGPGVNRVSVTRWLNAWRERGLDGSRPRRAKGAAPSSGAT